MIWSACMSSEPSGLPLLELFSPLCSSQPKTATEYTCFPSMLGRKSLTEALEGCHRSGQIVHCRVSDGKYH